MTVGMVREKHLVEGVDGFLAVVGHGHVLLLIHGFQFRVETAEDGVHEAVGLDAGPVVHLVGGDFLHVTGDIVGGEGVGAFGADDGHELVVFVGDGYFGSLVAHGVNLRIEGFALLRVREGAVHLEQGIDFLKQRTFCHIILRAQDTGALEHHVLQVVGQTGIVGGVVLTAHAGGDVGLDAGLVPVHGHVHLKTVFQRVNAGLKGISLNGFVTAAGCERQGGGGKNNQKRFHHPAINE